MQYFNCLYYIFVLIYNYFHFCKENYMASYNGYCTMLLGVPEVQIIPIHSENFMKEISIDSFTNFLSNHWEQCSYPQNPHLFYTISPWSHSKIFNNFFSLGTGSKEYDCKAETSCKCWWTASGFTFFPPENPPWKRKILFPLWNFLSNSGLKALCLMVNLLKHLCSFVLLDYLSLFLQENFMFSK